MNSRFSRSNRIFLLVLFGILAIGLNACGGEDGGILEEIAAGTEDSSSDPSSGSDIDPGESTSANNNEAAIEPNGNGDNNSIENESGDSEDNSSNNSATTPGTVPNPCNLIEMAEVEEILSDITGPLDTISENQQFGTCSWLGTGLEGEGGATIALLIWTSENTQDGWADKFFTSQLPAFPEPEEVPGLGEEALLFDDSINVSLFWNKDNAFVINLRVSGETSADYDDIISLGEKVDGRF